ncbi:MAG: hypothetical protein IPJ84_00480 [Bdellovibrionales bacterium]|nr:hypothetical protein [Bdellovibrionales bacterium]
MNVIPSCHLRRILFFNFAIDQLWDHSGLLKTVFPHRIPESERIVRSVEDLALYATRPGDIALISSPATSALIREDLPIGSLDLRTIKTNPYDTGLWLAEVEACLKDDFATSEFELWPIGLSTLERQLIKRNPQLRLPSWLDTNTDFAELNRKSTILDWARIGKSNCPPTEVITTTSLLNKMSNRAFQYPMVLKADFSSGGGGNFLIRSEDDTQFRVLKRRLEGHESLDALWVAQRWEDGFDNLSVYGWADDSEPEVCRVDYDENGLSSRHRPSKNLQQNSACRDCFLKISAHLQTLGYRGPFGLDLLFDQKKETQVPSLIDANIRLTKTHLISIAAERLGFGNDWISLRLRTRSGSIQDFLNKIENSDDLRPYHQADSREVSLFVSLGHPDREQYAADLFARLTTGESRQL